MEILIHTKPYPINHVTYTNWQHVYLEKKQLNWQGVKFIKLKNIKGGQVPEKQSHKIGWNWCFMKYIHYRNDTLLKILDREGYVTPVTYNNFKPAKNVIPMLVQMNEWFANTSFSRLLGTSRFQESLKDNNIDEKSESLRFLTFSSTYNLKNHSPYFLT